MGILDIVKRKKPNFEEGSQQASEKDLPEDFEQFRLPPPRIEEKPSPFGRVEKNTSDKKEESTIPQDILSRTTSEARQEKSSDKIDLILSKLETIDTRLKLIEEKMHK